MNKVFLPNTIVHWYNCYCVDAVEGTDRHQLFADCQKITRQEAKELCYKIGFSVSSSDVVKSFKEKNNA